MNSMIAGGLGGRCIRLALAMLGGWLLALVPALKLFGIDGLVAASFSAIVCFVAGCIVFRMASLAATPGGQISVVALGMLVRLAFASCGALVMHSVLGIAPRNYLVWLGLFYGIGLVFETVMSLQWRNEAQRG